MGQKSKVDAIIDKEEVMKDLSGFLLDSKDAFQCHNKKNEWKLMKILLPIQFGIALWLISMKQKPFIPTWWVF